VAINPRIEDLVALSAVPGLLPTSSRTGRPLSRQQVYEWTKNGRAGAKLETLTVTVTSKQALQRFLGVEEPEPEPDQPAEAPA
jgi:hypothetical protein